jgi:hypothetical protein
MEVTMKHMLVILGSLLAASSFADTLDYNIHCTGKADHPGTKLVLNTSSGENGDVLVKVLARTNGSPIGAAETFSIQNVKQTRSTIHLDVVAQMMFTGGGSYRGTLDVHSATRAGNLHLVFDHFNEATGHRDHSEKNYALKCQLTPRN